MRKVDWMAEGLSLSSILETLVEGNEKLGNDKKFLDIIPDILMSARLEKSVAREYGANILDLMILDDLDIRGDLLKKLWNLSGGRPNKFCQLLPFLRKIFTPEEIKCNLELERPVPFIENSFFATYESYRDLKSKNDYITVREFERMLEKSFVDRFNKAVGEERLHVEEFDCTTKEKMADDERLSLKNLFYGTASYDFSGGVVGMNFEHVAWFEQQDQFWRIGNEFMTLLREVPSGEYVLVNGAGTICEVDEPQNISDEITVFPNTKVRSVKVSGLGNILSDSSDKIRKLKGISEEIDNGLPIVENESLDYLYYMDSDINVGSLNKLATIVRPLYEFSYGKMFYDNGDSPKCKQK